MEWRFFLVAGLVVLVHGRAPTKQSGVEIFDSNRQKKESDSGVAVSHATQFYLFQNGKNGQSQPESPPLSGMQQHSESKEGTAAKRSNRKRSIPKYKYNPALVLLGLGKRFSRSDAAFKSVEREKRSSPHFNSALTDLGWGNWPKLEDPNASTKTNPLYETPVLNRSEMGGKNMEEGSTVLDQKLKFLFRNIQSNRFDKNKKIQSSMFEQSWLEKQRFLSLANLSNYMGLKNKAVRHHPSVNAGFGKRKFRYDPAVKYMGLGKRGLQRNVVMKYMGDKKRESQNKGPAKYTEPEAKEFLYDPAVKHMRLKKRKHQSNILLQSKGHEKKDFLYDPAVKYMGLGKREPRKKALLRYVESAEKRFSTYDDPDQNYMPKGKRDSLKNLLVKYKEPRKVFSYDPAVKYMGLGKRNVQFGPVSMYKDSGKRLLAFNRSAKQRAPDNRTLWHEGVVKYSPLAKRKYSNDFRYLRHGKTVFQSDPFSKYLLIGKRNSNACKTLNNRYDSGKRTLHYNAVMKLFKPDAPSSINASTDFSDSNNVTKYDDEQVLHSKSIDTDQHLILSKRSTDYVRDSTLRSRTNFSDNLDKIPGLGKRPYKYDPGLHLMGLGKRQEDYDTEFNIAKKSKMQRDSFQDGIEEDDSREEFFRKFRNMKDDPMANIRYKFNLNQYLNKQSQSKEALEDYHKENKDSNSELEGLEIFNGKDGSVFHRTDDGNKLHFSDILDKCAQEPNLGKDWKNIEGFGPAGILQEFKRRFICEAFLKQERIQLNQDPESVKGGLFDAVSNANSRDFLGRSKELTSIENLRLVPRRTRGPNSRPRYDPGWIFIGLGKRQENIFPARPKRHHMKISSHDMILNDYYTILNGLRDQLQVTLREQLRK